MRTSILALARLSLRLFIHLSNKTVLRISIIFECSSQATFLGLGSVFLRLFGVRFVCVRERFIGLGRFVFQRSSLRGHELGCSVVSEGSAATLPRNGACAAGSTPERMHPAEQSRRGPGCTLNWP